jgi:hypothetical protein
LAHNFVTNVRSESGNEEVQGDVIVAVLDTVAHEVEADLSTDSDVGSNNLR